MVKYSFLFLILLTGCSNQVSLKSLLEEMTSREVLTYFPEKEYRLLQSSSYNRKSVSPDSSGWFENNDMSHFIRVEENSGRREFVMLDTEGPGTVVRWWMTFYKAQNGIIRVYIDNSDTPEAEGSPAALLSGELLTGYPLSASVQKGAPIGETGRDYDHNFYLPIPFSKHCKITYECDSLRILHNYEGIEVPEGYYWPDVFYNIGYRIYDSNINVKSFSADELKKNRENIIRAGKSLLESPVSEAIKKTAEKIIAPGDSLVIDENTERMALGYLSVIIDSKKRNQALRSLVLKAEFDDIKSVLVPTGDFFGAGYTLQPHRTFFNSSDSAGNLESFWIMPFRNKCCITFINMGVDTVKVKAVAGFVDYKWNKRSMYFGSSWTEHHNMKSRDLAGRPFDLQFARLNGKGIYAGDQVVLYNNTYFWWGEGDEKIFVDGESFPSSFGTGSEDYYGYSFARQEPFSHPFISQPVGTGNMTWGVTVNMRHRMLDAIPFSKSVDARLEMWHWADIRMNFALTSYFYFTPEGISGNAGEISGARNKVSITREDFEINR
ncbi:MAG: DUF2961 domain-containing protein [Bacteroidales bacterium]